MKDKLIIIVLLVAVISMIYFYVQVNKEYVLKPYDNEFPAAGICGLSEERVADITINSDIPSPRCLKVLENQLLKITNNTDEQIIVGFNNLDPRLEKLNNIQIPPGGEYIINIEVGRYLEPGVHTLINSAYNGSGGEIWLVTDETRDF